MRRARDLAKDTPQETRQETRQNETPASGNEIGNDIQEGPRTLLPSRRRLLQGAALAAVPSALLTTHHAVAAPRAVDYPPAEWAPASTSNYTASNRPSSYPINYVIIHVTQETYADTLAIFKNPAKKVSAHYVVRSADGHIAQCVRERNVGWHAGNWSYNTRSIGIEHEGWVDQPEYFTDEMYEQSAALTAAICKKYGIPKNREHIIGHVEVPGTDHTDPGRHWDWTRYIRMVNFA
ncbi:N-acetylmuramoyl-L-alanine amidase [Streptomyces lasiicapitis]|uniref:N-acetylmuramoyl-L-alanine amidase n=1 Tax=Streptomyces lasiicapitis TaxID=1923961 RepID=A0ABQ2M920_9ACTN|nr:peptidoglycan recognition family protein [Streptomyces lasiicapitis]GGO48337.1 amidase [Streptomyces lasiicapitis]